MKTEKSPLTANKTKAAIARGIHLFPFRTEKLNPAAPMVLRKWESRQPPPSEAGINPPIDPGLFFLPLTHNRLPRGHPKHTAHSRHWPPRLCGTRASGDRGGDGGLKPAAGDRPVNLRAIGSLA